MREVARVHAIAPMLLCTAVGVIGLLLTFVGVAVSPHQALTSYLLAFAFFGGLSLSALVLVMSFHAAHAKWTVVLRRPMELIPSAAPLFLLLFIPIAVGLGYVFSWVHPDPNLDPHMRDLLAHKRPWLNPLFFLLRSAFYFLVWGAVAHLLLRWSTRQDTEQDERLTMWQRKLAAGGLPLVGFVIALAGTDWLMSLQPDFFSTIWGLYFFSGTFLASIAALILAIYWLAEYGPLKGLISHVHYHNLGKLMLAFLCFWAYMAFEQYLLIYIADLPGEIPWMQLRTVGAWKPVGWFLVIGHFVVPFFLLLSQQLKLRPKLLAAVAGWVLFVHWVDLYWVVMPELHPLSIVPVWTDLTALAGVGGITIAFFIFRLRGVRAVPVGDPYLEESVRYSRS
jgi:hypothetical protein